MHGTKRIDTLPLFLGQKNELIIADLTLALCIENPVEFNDVLEGQLEPQVVYCLGELIQTDTLAVVGV